MSSPGQQQSSRYGEVLTERAEETFSAHLGSMRSHIRLWQTTTLVALVLAVVLAVGLVRAEAKPPVRIYVLEIDSLGERRLHLIDGAYDPAQGLIAKDLAELVTKVRSRIVDPVVMKQWWRDAYNYLAGDAVQQMHEYIRSQSTGKKYIPRTVTIRSVKLWSRSTYEVTWTEVDFDDGLDQEPRHYSGLFHIEIMPPENDEEAFANPLGVRVTSFSVSRDFSIPEEQEPEETTDEE